MKSRGLCVWWFLLIGTLLTINQCQSRAVNISNTWTLPQEGFSVFYRFFRDKISWFEADAVCQFHHANLVTVENGVQFDAARAFLKELDVVEFVWIGLMRPQNDHHFMWTNSKPLDSVAGFWADPFPVMESPLCAVIDPIRDFRWHALRCGGPETAAFLCELEVPDWAAACTIPAMPSLTVQYMSDSGSVELSHDCGEQGTRHVSCRGKEDRDTILNELNCVDESIVENSLKAQNLTNLHQKSVEQIKSVSTDNNEDNNIDVKMNKVDEKKIEKSVNVKKTEINIEDMMLGDQPASETKTDKPEKAVKTSKSLRKKVSLIQKKSSQKKAIKKELDEEEMQGDQPIEAETANPTEIITKKITEGHSSTTTTPSPTTLISTTETRLRRETELSTNIPIQTTEISHPSIVVESNTAITEHTGTANVHPPKISAEIHHHKHHSSEETSHHSNKEQQEVDRTVDQFIPPMLLVRSKFTSTRNHGEEKIEQSTMNIINAGSAEPVSILPTKEITSTEMPERTTKISTTEIPTTVTTEALSPETTILPITEKQTTTPVTIQETTSATTHETLKTTESIISEKTEDVKHETTQLPETTKLFTTVGTTKVTVKPITESPKFRQPHAPQHNNQFEATLKKPKPSPKEDEVSTLLTASTSLIVTELSDAQTAINQQIVLSAMDPQDTTVSTILPPTTTIQDQETDAASTTFVSTTQDQEVLSFSASPLVGSSDESLSSAEDVASARTGADFTNSDDNLIIYRPNRRRVLTKPETHPYIHKILG